MSEELAAKIKQTLQHIEDLERSARGKDGLPEALFDLKRDLEEFMVSDELPHCPPAIEKTLRQLVSQSPDCLYLQDHDRHYVWFSGERPFGLDASLLLGKQESQVFPAAEAERLKSIKERVMETGARERTELCITIDGREKHLDVIYDPWRNESGDIIGLAGYARDITDKRQAEEETRKMTTAVEMTPTAIVLTSLEGRIEYVNPALLRDAGFHSASEVLGRSVFDFTNTEGKNKLEDEVMPALFSSGKWQGELTLRRTDGMTYITEMICALIRDDRGNPSYFLANFYNITERKRAEVALLLDDSRLEALQILSQMDDASEFPGWKRCRY